MNGIHDLGGMDNIGPLERESDEPVFHHDWERAVFSHAIAVLGAGYCKLDEMRRATEWMPPADYLQASYYETWLYATTLLLKEKGLVTEQELVSGRARSKPAAPPRPPLAKEAALYAFTHPIPDSLDLDLPAKFAAGDRILVRNINPVNHTRVPRYVRGRHGVVEQVHGVFLLPDTNAHGGPDRPQHVYGVRFTARELWGDDAPAQDALHIDLFEDYLAPARDTGR
jgi:nitrile hydratase